MQTAPLKKFSQAARRQLQESVAASLDKVLFSDSIARRENPKAVAELENRIKQTSREAVIERTAYIWFNRFCALRFMDVNHYTKLGTVTSRNGTPQTDHSKLSTDHWKLTTVNCPLTTGHCKLSTVPSSFPPDDDNVIPMLDGEWFTDDITERFFKFLRVTFGKEHYDENLRYLEETIGKDVRKYFLKDFYTDHIKRYKKRPIYWLFSSPKGSFNALIYMHRYRPDTVSVVLNDYLREFRTKLNAHIEHLEQVSISGSAKAARKVKAVKEMEKLKTIVDELNDYERDTLYPLATQKIEIDLDDGVKANYPKFGKALKKVPGLSK